MNLSLKKYLFLSLILIIGNASRLSSQELPNQISRPVILLTNNAPLLYHASFKVYKYTFTGLIVFKHISQEKGTRIIFLSEAGLSIAEFSKKGNTIECLKAMPMVDRKSAKKYFAKIIKMVLTPADCEKAKIKESSHGATRICKGKTGKHYYIYTSGILQEIVYKKNLFKRASGFLNESIKTEKVLIQKRNKLIVQMKIVENAIK